MSNMTGSGGSLSSGDNTGEEEVHQHQEQQQQDHVFHGQATAVTTSNSSTSQQPPPQAVKKKRNLPGTPDPTAEVIALSPTTLMATNRFVCEICNKGFQRDQNLQLHRRGHNLPWKLRQRSSTEIRKRVYICPETTCVHHNPSRALGDLTGIKKHFCRKHGEKKWKCDKCSKKYAVQSDWKAHSKTCGTREYKCDCGTIFSRRDSFITHRAFCDALAEESKRTNQALMATMGTNLHQGPVAADLMMPAAANPSALGIPDFGLDAKNPLKSLPHDLMSMNLKSLTMPSAGAGGIFSTTSGGLFGPRALPSPSSSLQLSANNSMSFDGLGGEGKLGRAAAAVGSAHMSATALLQKAAQMGATVSSGSISSPMVQRGFVSSMAGPEPIAGMRTYNPMQAHAAHEQLHQQESQPQPQPHFVGIDGGGFVSQFFDAPPADNPPMNGMEMFTAAGPNSAGLYERSRSTPDVMQGRCGTMAGGRLGARLGGGGGGSGDVTTVDFMGVGGARSAVSLHEQQQQGMDYELMSPHRLQGLHPYEQHMAHGHATMEKTTMWDSEL